MPDDLHAERRVEHQRGGGRLEDAIEDQAPVDADNGEPEREKQERRGEEVSRSRVSMQCGQRPEYMRYRTIW